jgi:sugar phosphate isomerase/epimerase
LAIAQDLGYASVGLRLRPNTPGAPHQAFIDNRKLQKEVLERLKNTHVSVFDIEIIRIAESFDPVDYRALLDAGAALGAKAVLVAGDDPNEARLSQHYARLCEFIRPYGMTADLEFMAWTGVKNAMAALRVIEQAGNPSNAGVLFDALHFGRSSTQLDDIAHIPSSLLHYAQMCDATPGVHFSTEELIHTAREERLLPGEGNIDIQGLFDRLPHGIPVSVEIPHFKRSKILRDHGWAKAALKAAQTLLAPRRT